MYLRRIVIIFLCLISLPGFCNTEQEEERVKKLLKEYDAITLKKDISPIYVVVHGVHYNNVREVSYIPETNIIKVTLGYKNKVETYSFNPENIDKFGSW